MERKTTHSYVLPVYGFVRGVVNRGDSARALMTMPELESPRPTDRQQPRGFILRIGSNNAMHGAQVVLLVLLVTAIVFDALLSQGEAQHHQ